ncbi:uncharacterized protein LOC144315097 [Canis aureus]
MALHTIGAQMMYKDCQDRMHMSHGVSIPFCLSNTCPALVADLRSQVAIPLCTGQHFLRNSSLLPCPHPSHGLIFTIACLTVGSLVSTGLLFPVRSRGVSLFSSAVPECSTTEASCCWPLLSSRYFVTSKEYHLFQFHLRLFG